MHREVVWDATVAERAVLHGILRDLAPEEWDRPSLCAGWRVRDVAAHVIMGPQLTWPRTLALLPDAWRGFNGMNAHVGRRAGSRPVAEILADFETYAALRRGPAVVTHLEPLVDVLVHTQDILRPLGRTHVPPVEAAAVAADRSRQLAVLLGSSRAVRRKRLRATDTAWECGEGPLVEGPVVELLMLCAGREPTPGSLRGDGVAASGAHGT